MALVLKYLKTSLATVALVIALLFAKAMIDLVLPFYTAQIVNIGIEQHGITSAVAPHLSQETFENFLSVADENEKELLIKSYAKEDGVYQLKEASLLDEETMIVIITKIEGVANGELGKSQAIAFVKEELDKLAINTATLQRSYIIKMGLKMLLLSALGMLFSVLVSLFASRVAATLGKNLREAIFTKSVLFNLQELESFSTASLVTRSTNDIQQVQTSFVMILRVVVFAPLMALGGLLRVLNTNANITSVIGLAIIAVLTVVMTMFVFTMPRFKKLQLLVDKINSIVRETLVGLPVIRAFNTQKHEIERFEKANTDLTRTTLFVNRTMSAMMPLMMLIMNLTAVFIVWKSSFQIEIGAMQVGDMMAFIQYSMLIIMSFLMITMLTIMLPRAAVSLSRIKEVLDKPIAIVDDKTLPSLDNKGEGKLVFDNVSFAYPDSKEPTLCNISFSVDKGSTTAIIGSTGSGKSTLLNLIPRFYDVTEGSITLDGVDIRKLSLKTLRKSIGYVPQKGMLLSGTIESNIAFGKENLSEQQIVEASKIAAANSFIQERAKKYQDPIAQGGVNVSGGQRQRLSIARAIVAKPPFLLFDDSFSALDYKTEAEVRDAMQKNLEGTTIIIVAQRISTIIHADNIVVLDEGRIVGQGKHKKLLKECEVYRQIAASQLSAKELNDYESA